MNTLISSLNAEGTTVAPQIPSNGNTSTSNSLNKEEHKARKY